MSPSLPVLVLGALIGVVVGVGGFTFVYANGASYLTDNSEACVNCHVMRDQFDGWERASHRSVAGCNDCHTPPNLIGKYVTKARNGFWHSYYFTFGGYPDPIRITAANRDVTESACRGCHEAVVDVIDPIAGHAGDRPVCTACHRDVGHLH